MAEHGSKCTCKVIKDYGQGKWFNDHPECHAYYAVHPDEKPGPK
jgi:hypothetical protein